MNGGKQPFNWRITNKNLSMGYDTGVRVRPLALGDLVLRKVVGTAKNPSWGNLWPN